MLRTTLKMSRISPRLTTLLIKKVNPVFNIITAFSIGRLYQLALHKRRVLSQGGF